MFLGIISQEHVSGQSGLLAEHLRYICKKDNTRLKVERDPSTRYNEGVLTSTMTLN